MKIGIIGGSIAGCALALFLKDKFEVTVFERSKDLKSRGAGITMSNQLLHTLLTKNILDKEIITYSVSSRSFYCQSPYKPEYGDCIWQQGISMVCLHWDTLFTNLRQRLSNDIYKTESEVISVTLADEGRGSITLKNGESQKFDLVVFADGSLSMGRAFISEESQLEYSGYIAWRGILDFDLIKDKAPFINKIPYYCFNNGHFLAYPVNHDNVKKLNWVFYEKLPLEDLEKLGQTSITNFSDQALHHLHELAYAKLPKAIAQIVLDTESPFMQKIIDGCVERLTTTKGAVLLGDASVILRPHVGSGASLAIQDALNLSEALCNDSDILEAIAHWEKLTLANRLSSYELSKRMGDALVLKPVLWQGMNSSKMEIWWEQILKGEHWYTTTTTQTIIPSEDDTTVELETTNAKF